MLGCSTSTMATVGLPDDVEKQQQPQQHVRAKLDDRPHDQSRHGDAEGEAVGPVEGDRRVAVRDQPQLRHRLQKIAGRDPSPQRALAAGKHPRSLLRPPIEAETPRGQAIKSEPTPVDTTSSPLPHSLLQPSLVACVFTPTLSTPKQTLASGRPRPLAPRIDALPGTPYPTPQRSPP